MPTPPPRVAGCTIEAISAGTAIRVEIAPAPAPALSEEAGAAWSTVQAANPRAHDGEILAYVGHGADGDGARQLVLRARRDRYARLAVQPGIELNVHLLAARGVLTARDHAGNTHVLLGQRHAQTRLYGGLWEFGPSGGVEPPAPHARELRFPDLVSLYARELREEAGLAITEFRIAPLVLCHDHPAHGFDLVLHLELAGHEKTTHDLDLSGRNWEYRDVRWAAVGELRDSAESRSLSPPTRAIGSHLGWL